MSVRLGSVAITIALLAAPAWAQTREDVAAAWNGLRFDEASRLIEAGLAAHPDDADLLALRAVDSLSRGDVAHARADAEAALRAQPGNAQAKAILEDIRLGERAQERLGRMGTEFDAGTPQAGVDKLIEDIGAGRDARAVAEAFDLEIVPGMGRRPTRRDLVEAVDGGLREMRTQAAKGDLTGLGWIVAPEARQEGDRSWVHVDAPMEAVFTAEQKAAYEQALAEPVYRPAVDPLILDNLLRVPPSERASMLDDLVGHRTRATRSFEFELVRRRSTWRISDITTDGVSLRGHLGAILASAPPDEPAPDAEQVPFARQLGRLFGRLLFFGALIGVPLAIFMRRRR